MTKYIIPLVENIVPLFPVFLSLKMMLQHCLDARCNTLNLNLLVVGYVSTPRNTIYFCSGEQVSYLDPQWSLFQALLGRTRALFSLELHFPQY